MAMEAVSIMHRLWMSAKSPTHELTNLERLTGNAEIETFRYSYACLWGRENEKFRDRGVNCLIEGLRTGCCFTSTKSLSKMDS